MQCYMLNTVHTRIGCVLPIAHIAIFLSSPPVASIRPLYGVIATAFTFDPWATNSSKTIEIAYTLSTSTFPQ